MHYPHLDSNSRLEWNKKPKEMKERRQPASDVVKNTADEVNWQSFKRARVDALFLDFKEWLVENVDDEARVPKCDDSANDDVHLWVHKEAEGNNAEGKDEGEEDNEEEDGVDDKKSVEDKSYDTDGENNQIADVEDGTENAASENIV